ncbi:peptidoglycan amidohydrolase family protein [Enterococcus casseliflavus]|uniref:peptidoglycan amidohydrolase family protein n=1 Tax=Enterococcus casseliflavus TaxID=37734 RepID=UPI0028904241|nr:peptidoglycan amidohydrolase family protein [Enterococcus casseliflavus]MDT2973441.1 peptidoglycan amidohydrolase family protein [Enterococcus casseliflavus]
MSSVENMIKWFKDREGKVTYSMERRLGPKSYDCSSAVFLAMIAGGFLPTESMGNTETLFRMVGTKLKEISRSEVKRGDIFVAGTPGKSDGSGGHTGIFLSNQSFIHCSYYWNGIHTDSHDSYMSTRLTHHFYRIVTTGPVKPTDNKPQMIQLAIDGQLGNATARRLQEYFDTAGKDGVISHQYKQKFNQNIHAAEFDNSLIGSNVVVALQKFLGVTQDGLMGQATIRALQKRLGTTQDGIISPVSDAVKELQRRLNKNQL